MRHTHNSILGHATHVISTVLAIALSPIAFAQAGTQHKRNSDYVFMVRIPATTRSPAAIQTGFRLRGIPGIVTALHGTVGGGPFSAINEENDVFSNLVIGSVDIENDIAVLVSNDRSLQTQEGLATSRQTVAANSLLHVYGHPLGINLHLQGVQVGDPAYVSLSQLIPPASAQAFERRKSPAAAIQVLDLDTTLAPGDSGAPILDDNGGVVGVADGGLFRAAISWAIVIGSIQPKPLASNQTQIAVLEREPAEELFSMELDEPVRNQIETIVWQFDQANARMGKLAGTVHGPNGQPLVGVKVQACHYADRKNPFGNCDTTVVTSDRGEYEISVPAGGYCFFISKPSYETKEMFYIPILPGFTLQADDTLQLESGATRIFSQSNGFTDPDDPHNSAVVGRISDYSGQAIEGAFVTATTSDDSPDSWHGRTVTTDSNGNFKIVNLAAALYDLTIEAHGYRTVYLMAVPTASGYGIRIRQQLSLLRRP